jgi:aspartyl/asparaginyl beta-hydroxylase (cupin superfamily)
MDSSTKNKIWYASSMRPYPGNDPCFFDTEKSSWAVDIEKHWDEYKDEVANFIAEKDTKFLSTSSLYGNIETSKGWSVLSFLFWGMKRSRDFENKCPKMAGALKQIPGIVSISLSRLAPGSLIAEHNGDTNAVIRSHFGIEIPGTLPQCGFKVNGAERNWEEGKWLLYNDACRHSAWNYTDKRRIIMILDVIRPEFLNKKNIICAFIITRHISYMYHSIKIIAKMPVLFKTMLFAFFLGIVYIFKPLYNLFK